MDSALLLFLLFSIHPLTTTSMLRTNRIVNSITKSFISGFHRQMHCAISANSLRGKFAVNTRLRAKHQSSSSLAVNELLLVAEPGPAGLTDDIQALIQLRPQISVINGANLLQTIGCSQDRFVWMAFRGGIQLESMYLDPAYLGKQRLSPNETALQWLTAISNKMDCLLESKVDAIDVGDGGGFQDELNAAVNVVQRAVYMIRALQYMLLNQKSTSINKCDSSPVTIADYAAQALIIEHLRTKFPTDLFIAEEDSDLLRNDSVLRNGILEVLFCATGETWTEKRLFEALDAGKYEGSVYSDKDSSCRIWVLDPIDGTKGFMRGAHCCTALGLLVEGNPTVSVMGCPNINLLRSLQGISYDDKPVEYIDGGFTLSEMQPELRLFHMDAGSIYFAVTGRGAFARSLSMPTGAAFEVSPLMNTDAKLATLCESAEESFGSRDVTAVAANALGIRKTFIRIDGMCKHALVGSGAADGTLRLPPHGYQEKIWDHVAGQHFVTEAGGIVTDLNGDELDFTQGRRLSRNVTGVVVASNRVMHNTVLQQVQAAKAKIEQQED